jgi:PhnB protein
MELNAYLVFNGKCREAFTFYERCFGGKIEAIMTVGESPMAEQAPPDQRNNVIHARMVVDGKVLMGSDAPAAMYEQPKGFSVTITVDDPGRAERLFNELAQGGSIRMPLQQTFWSPRFGMLVDRFGIPWMISCSPEAQPSEKERS